MNRIKIKPIFGFWIDLMLIATFQNQKYTEISENNLRINQFENIIIYT